MRSDGVSFGGSSCFLLGGGGDGAGGSTQYGKANIPSKGWMRSDGVSFGGSTCSITAGEVTFSPATTSAPEINRIGHIALDWHL